MNKKLLSLSIASSLLLSGHAAATNGYIQDGIGVKAQGLAGAGIALPQDALAAATNPAGTAFVDDRYDGGLTLFRPDRGSSISGNNLGPGASADGSYDGSARKSFIIPEFGVLRKINDRYTAGVAVYGNGGMNTDYRKNPYAAYGSTGNAGINLEQLVVTPSLAARITENQAVGVALNLTYQRFKATGLGAFDNPAFTQSPGKVTDNGNNTSTGAGVRLGWTGKLTPTLTAGVTWASKVYASRFNKYQGLFADGGSFDTPANFGAGLAWQVTKPLTLVSDIQRIQYSDIASVGNPLENLFAGNRLGSPDGPGFGWRDITVIKVGASYVVSPQLTLRTGYSHSTQPIPSSQTFLNILAPGVIQDHVTAGLTWQTRGGTELSAAYTRGLRDNVRGAIPASFGGGQADIYLSENILAVSLGRKF